MDHDFVLELSKEVWYLIIGDSKIPFTFFILEATLSFSSVSAVQHVPSLQQTLFLY